MLMQYDKRSALASGATTFVADNGAALRHGPTMLGSVALLEALRRLKADGKTTNADLGRVLGLPSSRIAEIFTGQRAVKIDEMKALVEHFGLENGGAPPQAANDDEVVEIQQLDLTLSMGPGTLIDDYVEANVVKFDMAFLRAITRAPFARLKLVTGIGDSMYPTLNGGDVIMIDTTDRQLAKQDGIYWISLYGAAGLKRLRTIGPGRVLVKSDNPTVGDQEVLAADLRIEGRAIWFARGL